jgi:hypothetical protein
LAFLRWVVALAFHNAFLIVKPDNIIQRVR